MYCPSCGTPMPQKMKYCNRCGSQLIATKENALVESTEARLYEETVGIFWVTVIGLALILGGMVLLKVLQFNGALITAYMIISSTAFTINFALSLWQIRRFAQISKEARDVQHDERQPNDARRGELQPALEPVTSVTEHTTRGLEPASKRQNT